MASILDQLAFMSVVLLVTVRLSGLICLVSVALGFTWVSWLVYKLVYNPKSVSKCPTERHTSCAGSSRAASRRASSSGGTTNGVTLPLSVTSQEGDMGNNQSSNEAIWYSTLQRRHGDSVIGAQILERNTGSTLSGEIPTCLGGTEGPDTLQHSSQHGTSVPREHDPKRLEKELDIMKDSGFLEPAKQVTPPLEVTESEATEGQHSSASSNNDSSTGADYGCSSIINKNEPDTDSSVGSRHDTQNVETSALSPTLVAAVSPDSQSTPELPAARFDTNALQLPDMESASELDDLFSESTPTSAQLKRKSFSEMRDRYSLPSPILSVKAISRTSSLRSECSFELEVDSEIPATVSFTSIESDLAAVLHELAEHKATVDRLYNLESGEFYSTPSTTLRLSNLVGALKERLTQAQIDKGFDILRKERTSIEAPRMSSLPPSPVDGKSSDLYAEDNKIIESKSFHDLPRYVLHEDVACNVTIVGDGSGDTHSIDSSSTVETYLDSDRCDSIPSVDSLISSCSCVQEDNGSGVVEDVIVVDIAGYVSREWKGDTSKAECIRKGYASVMDEHQFKHIARIRGDNYCALRATFASIVLNNVKLILPLEQTLQRLAFMNETDPSLLQSWLFPECMSDVSADDSYDTLCQCIELLVIQIAALQRFKNPKKKMKELCRLLNTGGIEELYILESLKLLMLVSAYELHKLYSAGQEVPVFTWLMFARDTSETPELFLKNHLNNVGRDSGVEQVEMCLLGYSLGITLQTFRLYQHGEVDFIALYPEDDSPKTLVPVIAEDDRHYNTLVQPDNNSTCIVHHS